MPVCVLLMRTSLKLGGSANSYLDVITPARSACETRHRVHCRASLADICALLSDERQCSACARPAWACIAAVLTGEKVSLGTNLTKSSMPASTHEGVQSDPMLCRACAPGSGRKARGRLHRAQSVVSGWRADPCWPAAVCLLRCAITRLKRNLWQVKLRTTAHP